jgi:hypothetical protein
MKKLIILILCSFYGIVFSCSSLTLSRTENFGKNSKKTSTQTTTKVLISNTKSIVFKSGAQKKKRKKEIDSDVLEFVGDAGIQKAISEKSEIPANAGIGVRFARTYGTSTSWLNIKKFESDLSITIASSIDTLLSNADQVQKTSMFGNSILLPLNSGQSVSVYFRAYIDHNENIVLGKCWGIQGSLCASNRVWQVKYKSYDGISSCNVSTLAFNIGFFTDQITIEKKDYSISLGLDFSSRLIFGNVTHAYADNFRESLLGTKRTFFPGIEPNLTIRLKDLKATASFPIMFSDRDVRGLTKGQFVTMIRFTGGFPVILK